MANEFLLILYLAIFGIVASVPMIIVPVLFAPKKKTPMKLATFEAGQPPAGESKVHLMMQYYAYLLMFVVFDVITMFLFAWGSVFGALGIQSLLGIGLFLAIILTPMGYAIYMAGRRELW